MYAQQVTFELLCAAGNRLGEGIRYDRGSDTLDWVDIPDRLLHELGPNGVHRQQPVAVEPGFAVRNVHGDMLIGGDSALVLKTDMGDGALSIEDATPDTAINDGAVHPDGSCLVFGSRHRDESAARGRMWIATDAVRRLPHAFTVFNGPAFSPSGDRLYFADSPEGIIWTAPFDRDALDVGPRTIFAQVPSAIGFPDGMVVDDEGFLWSAHWDGRRITRYRPDGAIDQIVETPVARPTSLAFFGPDRRMMAVTSAASDTGMPPWATDVINDGDVFAFDAGVSGPPSPRLRTEVVVALFSGDAGHAA